VAKLYEFVAGAITLHAHAVTPESEGQRSACREESLEMGLWRPPRGASDKRRAGEL